MKEKPCVSLRSKKRKKVPGSLLLALCVAEVLALAVLGSLSFAKYTFEQDGGTGPYSAETFAFTSNLLEEVSADGTYPSYTLQEGTSEISIQLRNYPDYLRYAEMDITYRVDLIHNGEVIESETGKIKEKEAEKNHEDVVFSDLEAGVYTVRAQSLQPYAVTLQAKFTLPEADSGLEWSLSDGKNSPDLLITVTTEAYEGEAVISWPEGVYPDNTDGLLADAEGNSHKVYLAADSEYSFRFFKADPGMVYTGEESLFAVGKVQ